LIFEIFLAAVVSGFPPAQETAPLGAVAPLPLCPKASSTVPALSSLHITPYSQSNGISLSIMASIDYEPTTLDRY